MKEETGMDLNKAMNNLKESKKRESDKLAKLVEKKSIKKESVGEKKLTELRHVDKKVIVKGYDFKELPKERQEKMIDDYNKRNGRTSDKKTRISDLRSDIGDRFKKEILEKTIYNYASCSVYEDEGITYANIGGNLSELCPKLSSELKLNNEDGYYATSNIYGNYLKNTDWGDANTKILELLKTETNYRELDKSTKKEILLKLQSEKEKAREITDELNKEYMEKLKEIEEESGLSFDKVNEKAISELSEYWYTEDGDKIIEKSKAKVVSNVNENLLKEAPVDLEFDRGYDVYSYDDLDDYAKANAFSSTERSRKNEYDKRFGELEKRILDATIPVFEKAGLKVIQNGEDKYSSTCVKTFNKGTIDSVLWILDPASVEKYAKDNNIDLEGHKVTFAYVSLYERKHGYGFSLNINVRYEGIEYSSDLKGDKDLEKEIEMDVEAVQNIVPRIDKQFKQEIDDEFKNKMSTDRKLKRREYDSRGNVYRKKDHPEDV